MYKHQRRDREDGGRVDRATAPDDVANELDELDLTSVVGGLLRPISRPMMWGEPPPQ